jgi:sortase A
MNRLSLWMPILLLLVIIGCQTEGQQPTVNDVTTEKEVKQNDVQEQQAQISEPLVKISEPTSAAAQAPGQPSLTAVQPIIPVRIQIPSIKVDAMIENVGILDNGQMGVPEVEKNVGWFEPGYKPGQNGSAVMAGHVDNKTGPSVFFYLKTLKKGDKVLVTSEDGRTLSFVVTNIASYKTEESPIDYIFGKTVKPRLNLITCTGNYNRKTDQHEKRLVVFTELDTSAVN